MALEVAEIVSNIYGPGDNEQVVTGGGDRPFSIWKLISGEQVADYFENGHSGATTGVALSPDCQSIVGRSWQKEVTVWDAGSYHDLRHSLKGHTASIECVAMTGDGRRIASGSSDKTIRVYESQSGNEVCDPLKGHAGKVTGVSFVADADRIVSCSWDGTVRIWDFRQTGKRGSHGHEDRIMGVSYSPDGQFVISGSLDGILHTWNATSGEIVGDPLKAHTYFVTDVSVTPNGRCVVSVSFNKRVRLWDLESHELLREFTGHTDHVRCVKLTPRGDRAVTGSNDKTVRMWDLVTKKDSHVVLEGHSVSVERVFVTDDGLRIVSVDVEDSIFVWELETKKLLKQFRKEAAWKLSRTETLEVVGETTVYDTTTLSIPRRGHDIFYGKGPNLQVLATLEGEACSWALSPDKRTMCVGLYDGQVAFMKLETEKGLPPRDNRKV